MCSYKQVQLLASAMFLCDIGDNLTADVLNKVTTLSVLIKITDFAYE